MASVALRIGEVARRAGLSVRTLRHYDDLGLLVPTARSHGSQRLYSPEDLRRLLSIQHLKALGLSLAEVRAALDDPGFEASTALSGHIAAVETRLAGLEDLLARLRAMESAAEAGWEEVLGVVALTERLQHPEAGVRVRAALDGGADAPLDVLLDRLADEPDDHVADTITWAVVRHGPAAVGPAVQRLTVPDPRQRLRVVRALGKLADAAAVPALLSALADGDPRVQSAAVTALGRIADPVTLPSLVDRMGGPDEGAVTDALARFGSAAVDPLSRVLRDGGAGARRHAASALGATGEPSAASVLAERLVDEDPAVRLAAVLGLGELPLAAAGAAIRRARTSSDPTLAAVATRLLAVRKDGGTESPW